MIKHAAVCIVLRLFSTADDVIFGRARKGVATDAEAETGREGPESDGRVRWRVSWLRRGSMR